MKIDDQLELKPAFLPRVRRTVFRQFGVRRWLYRDWQRLGSFCGLQTAVRSFLASVTGIAPNQRLKLLSAAMRQGNVIEALCFARSVAKDFDAVLAPEVLRRTVSLQELFAEAAKMCPADLSAPEIAMRLDGFYTLPDDYLQKVVSPAWL
jgi:hypothetical protein